MKILICDDEENNLRLLQLHIEEYMKNHFIPCDITLTANPLNIVFDEKCYDLAFLDIQMDGIDGISLAKELRSRNSKLVLFFITNYDEYQDDAMDLRAFRFFEKPFDVNRLYSSLDKAMEYIDGAYVDVFIATDGTLQRILVDDILYVTRNNRKVMLVTKSSKLYTAEKYDVLCEKLSPLFFYSVHNSFHVNLHYVSKYSYSELTLTDGTWIPIATRKQSSFHKFWFEYLRRR